MSVVVCGVLTTFLTNGSRVSADVVEAVSLSGIALATYAWGIYASTAAGALLSGVILLNLLWGWGVHRMPEFGLMVAAGAVLVTVAVNRRRRRLKRSLRMSQVLDDLHEERTVKDQAIRLAQQTREGLQKKLARYQRLQTIAERLSNLLDLTTITKLAVDSAYELIGKSEVCLLFLVDKERQALSLFASRRVASAPSIQTKHGDQFDRHVLRTHRPLLVNDVRRDFRFTMAGPQVRPISSVISCPLLIGQNAEGVLRLDSARPGAYNQDDLRFLDILLDLVSTSVANARLFAKTQQLAMTDGLTGLLLRRPFLEQLGRELIRAARSRESLSVLMLDLDEFKSYNDTYGHTAGDVLLATAAEVLRQVVPAGGVAARYGGEEFAVLLPRTPRERAKEIAEKIRATMERDVAKVSRADRAPVTVSVGVAEFPDDAQAELELIRMADKRLYEAKRSGKNRVCA